MPKTPAPAPAAPPLPRGIEYVPLEALLPDPRNPKAHDVGTIDASVGRFGYIEPIIRDDRTGHIVSGHGRTKTLTAMRDRGETAPEGVVVDEEGRWLVPVGVGWASRTDAEAAAALIALNRTTELGGWVDESLLELLDELSANVEGGLVGVGFTEKDAEDLRKVLHLLTDAETDALADSWDGSGLPAVTLVRIEVRDQSTAALWAAHAEPFDSDDEALSALLRGPSVEAKKIK